ncbi:MAG TPA: M48 family metalloprotease [Terriglobales bacterium]|nr:M48 family metalloprotease [Terriglobales bacterium]
MHILLGTSVSLAVFGLVYTCISLVVCCGWKFVAMACRRRTPSFSAAVLFTLRVLPFFAAAAITLGVALPSFLLLEPQASNEPVGIAPFALGCFCLALLIVGSARAVRSQRRTSRAVSVWLRHAVTLPVGENVLLHEACDVAPALVVAGVRAPKVIASRTVLAALSQDELRTAIRHEVAHVRRHDNFKKLLFRLCVFFGMSGLEEAWAHAAELAADDDAVSNERDALDLAAALIKVSRVASQPTPELATGLVASQSLALSTRVQRLLAWKTAPAQASALRYVVPPVMLIALGLLLSYSAALNQMHVFTEWLVR